MTTAFKDRSAIIIYEDRPRCETGIRLLVASLLQHLSAPTHSKPTPSNHIETGSASAVAENTAPLTERRLPLDIHIFAPNATPSLQHWLAPRPVTLHLTRVGELGGCDIKPAHFLWTLDQGYRRVVWFDSDMILTQSPPSLLIEAPEEVLVASQLARKAQFVTHEHTAGWDMPLGRRFRRIPSNCCMSVTNAHRSFLGQWQAMSASDRYQHWQAQPRNSRPLCFRGSDAVFLALLGSKPYETLDVRLLKTGRDIAQCISPGSYTPDERLSSLLFGLPAVIHAMGIKPWLASGDDVQQASVSPYACVARAYANSLEEPQAWLNPTAPHVKRWHDIVKGHPALASLPQAVQDWAAHLGLRSTIATIRYNLELDHRFEMLKRQRSL